MRFLRLFAISGLVMFLLLTFIGLLFPSTVLVSRSATINQQRDSVRFLMKDMKQWKRWIKDGGEQTITFQSQYTSGKGTVARIGGQEVKMTESSDSLIRTAWRSDGSGMQNSYMRLFPAEQQTIVNWTFEQELGWYPWERFGSMMNDKILGPLMEQSLANLKTLAESGKITHP